MVYDTKNRLLCNFPFMFVNSLQNMFEEEFMIPLICYVFQQPEKIIFRSTADEFYQCSHNSSQRCCRMSSAVAVSRGQLSLFTDPLNSRV